MPAIAQPASGVPASELIAKVQIPYRSFTLSNGLRVIVHTDRKAPVVAVSVWYDVGSKHEPTGKTGFAHLFEHLMFQGSENAPGDFFGPLREVGATDFNGTTNFDRTNYFQTVPRPALDRALFLESDRMGHLLGAIDQALLDEQRGVVQNEKRQGDNQPYGLVNYPLIEQVLAGTPYGHHVIGSMQDLDAASLDDVKNWFRRNYGPNNAVLVLAGDVDEQEARPLVERYFGDIPAGPATVAPSVTVPTLPEPRHVTLKDRVAATLIVRSPRDHWDALVGPGVLRPEGREQGRMKQVRCAIYTRKSSDEGLEQGFNSLHAQREACAAYVMSQASEGWTLLPAEYDDGGISGGTLERPGLQKLLADIGEGKIDIVVVYKVDRLTRSLFDFAKLVETFDKTGTSFVSITQSFNTTTSMGRLTLNMLLSFAQFEREVTAERIRDKLAASKAKGMWMGGIPPIGYKPNGRTLAIVEPDAAVVRDIYDRYLKLGNVRSVADALAGEGIIVPKRKTGTGRALGGAPFSRGQIYSLLKNPIYAGDIAHRDKIAPGNHPALIERAQWEAVQRLLAEHVHGSRTVRGPRTSPLTSKIFDAAGEPLLATHTSKPGKGRYRYYVSKALHHRTSEEGVRLPAREVEQVVAQALTALLADPLQLAALSGLDLQSNDLKPIIQRAEAIAAKLGAAGADIGYLLERVVVHDSGLNLVISTSAVSTALDVPQLAGAAPSFTHSCPARLTRTGRAIRLIHDTGARAAGTGGVDPAMLRLITRAQDWWNALSEGHLDPTGLAEREGVTDSYVVRVTRLAFLSPRVIDGILAGQLRPGIDCTALLKAETISLDWEEQEKRLLAG